MEKLISVQQLQDKLNTRENVFILDVRPADQRNEWHISESVHVDAYQKLNAGDNTILDQVEIPKDATVVTVCAAGRTSLIASKVLQEKGINAYSLEGGMKAWNYAWNQAEISFFDTKIIQVRRPAKGVLSYVVGSAEEAIVIDAALSPEVYVKIARENNWKIKYVMDTHVHADYVSRTRELATASGAQHVMIDSAKVDYQFEPVSSNNTIHFGNQKLEFIHTPGHTWESTSFKLGDVAIFTGDTLFADSVGRPDLKADAREGIEKAKALYNSLQKILSFDAGMMVFPAHTADAITFNNKIIGDRIEKIKSRIKILELNDAEFINYTSSKVPPTPPNYQTIALINKQGSYEGHVLADLEAGGNHCAIA